MIYFTFSGCHYIPKRFVICALCSSGIAVVFYKRRCVKESLELLKTLAYSPELDVEDSDCPFMHTNTHLDRIPHTGMPHFYWSNSLVQAIIQIFYVGYIIFQIPAGMVVDWYGSQRLFGLGMLLSSIFCLLFPFLASLGPYWLFAGHFFQGIAQSVVFPCVLSLVARWAPISQRSTYTGIIIGGMYIGNPLSQMLFNTVFDTLGFWQIGLISSGLLGLGWCLLWFCFAEDYPTGTMQLGGVVPKIPWMSILKSHPFLSLVLLYSARTWTHLLITDETAIPYLENVLHLSPYLSDFSTMVKLCAVPTSVAGGVLSDWLVNNNVVSTTVARRIFISVGVLTPTCLMVLIPLTGCDRYAFIGLFVIIVYMSGWGVSSIHGNPIDLSPHYAGLLMGIMNCIGMLTAMFSQRILYNVITEPSNVAQWSTMFWYSLLLTVFLLIPFMFCSSGEEQPWSLPAQTPT